MSQGKLFKRLSAIAVALAIILSLIPAGILPTKVQGVESGATDFGYLHATYDEDIDIDNDLKDDAWRRKLALSDGLKISAAWDQEYLYFAITSDTEAALSDLKVNNVSVAVTSDKELRIPFSAFNIVFDREAAIASFDISFTLGGNAWTGILALDTFSYAKKPIALTAGYGAPAMDGWKMVLNTNTFTANDSTAADTARDLAAAEDHWAFIDRVMEETEDMDIDWTIVLYHQSPYGSSYHNDYTLKNDSDFNRTEQYAYINIRKFLVPKLYEVGVDLVLSGHDHCYTRTHILKPATDSYGNYVDAAVITPYEDGSYVYADGTTEPTYVSWTDGSGNTYTDLKVSSKPVKVINPDGILHITGGSSSGSQINSVKYEGHYAAATSKPNTRQVTRIDISENELTIVTYNLGANNTELISEIDRFTIEITVDRDAIEAVEDSIEEIGEVKLESKAAIEAARAAYDALSDKEKALVANYETLTAAEAKLEQLQDAANKPGSPEKPIEIPADKETVKEEAKVEAGSEQHYELDEKLAGKTITIKGEDAYAIIDGKKYEAVDGVLEVKLPVKTGKIPVVIGNAGTKAGTFSITIATPSEDNSDTGDNAAVVLFSSLMMLSVLAAGALLVPDIRKRILQ